MDCVGIVAAREQAGDALLIDVSVPQTIETLMVLHGSVAVDGVSLTVNELKPGGLQLSLIDYTLRHTTLGELKVGSRVHVEADMLGKYVLRAMELAKGK